ncbi:MAG: FtsX-like permease family protein, partial [Bacteroidota bacterium]
GSEKKQLVAQFLVESILITLVSACLAIGITSLFQPAFEQLSGRDLSILEFATPLNISLFTLGVLVLGGIAGLYPAFVISSYSPLSIVKGNLQTSGRGILLRNALVVLQFTISIGLISVTLIVYNQMDFMLNKPLGFDEDQIVIVENAFAVNNNLEQFNWERIRTFRDELVRLDGVVNAGYGSALPGDGLEGFVIRIPGQEGKESLVTRMISMDDKFASAMGMEILEGRNFSPDFNDSLSVLVNESTVEQLSLDEPIGQKLYHLNDSVQVPYTIVGVIENFHFESLHSKIEPMVVTSMEAKNGFVNKFAVRVSPGEIENTLSAMENKWGEFVPQGAFRYYFLDSSLEQFYEAEKASSRLFTVFTLLAILVACVGLLGLSAFIITQKTKEIGIRKVLGGSVQSIVLLLSKDILKLVTISAVIAIPISYYWASGWLDNFAYSIPVSWLVFVVSGIGALLIAFLTVSIQSTKAARANPVDSLKDE